MWIVMKQSALNTDRLKKIYIKDRHIFADKKLIYSASTKDEAEHIFKNIMYSIDIGYGKIDVYDVVLEYRKIQEKKHQMEMSANGKQ